MKQKEYEIGIESVREMRDYRIERKFVSGWGDEEFMLQFLFFVSPLVFLCSLSPCLTPRAEELTRKASKWLQKQFKQ